MRKIFILLLFLCFVSNVYAFDYVPKNTEINPFSKTNSVRKEQKEVQPEMREIKTLAEYFKYLPNEVHRNWAPYKAERDYEVIVQFKVHRDGSISGTRIISTDYPNANSAVLNAVKSGAPYQPLPKSYSKDSVNAQVVLEYHKQ